MSEMDEWADGNRTLKQVHAKAGATRKESSMP